MIDRRGMSGQLLFSFRMVPVISSMLAMRRIDARALVKQAGLPDGALNGDVIAPLPRVQRFIDLAAEQLEAPLFGIDLADRVPTGYFGVTEFLMRSAPSIERALEVLCEFGPLVNPVLDLRFDSGRFHVAVPSQRDALGMHLNEYTLMLLVRQFGQVIGEAIVPDRVWFAHVRRAHVAEVAARFGCEVTFHAADCGIALPKSVLQRVAPTADPALFQFLTTQARAQLQNLASRDIVSQVARVVEARLESGALGGNDVAKAMAITFRSLQRYLADAGTSYREVLHHVRLRRRAELSHAGLEPAQIARRLGFSGVAAMRRSLDEDP
jgi:AraC-like DNA-binding protein